MIVPAQLRGVDRLPMIETVEAAAAFSTHGIRKRHTSQRGRSCGVDFEVSMEGLIEVLKTRHFGFIRFLST